MNCFQIIKSVLDEAYNQIAEDESEKDQQIKDALEYLTIEYRKLSFGHDIKYNHPVTRFAYIYRYVTSHANLVCSVIEQNSDLGNIFNHEKVNVACIGGGPGSDFLGILKYLMTNNKSPQVKFQLCDKEKTWAESWNDVDDKVDPKFRISTNYFPLDVTDLDDWKPYKNYYKSDVFTMIYFMSEVYASRDSSEKYFATLFAEAKPGALFLFIDNNSPKFYNWFDNLAGTYNIEIIKKNESNFILPFDEEKSDLGVYLDKFSYPKIRANIAYRIGKKQ